MFRFSIREMMLVTLMVAMGVAWWLDRSHLASDAGRYKEALMKLRRMGLGLNSLINSPDIASELNAEWEAEHAARIAQKKSRQVEISACPTTPKRPFSP